LAGGNATPVFELAMEVRDVTGRLLKLSDLGSVRGSIGGRDSGPNQRRVEVLWHEEKAGIESYEERGHLDELRSFTSGATAALATLADAVAALEVCEQLLVGLT
jgi:hypothetical protein